MKKTKLLTSLAALALVLGLGACEEPVEEETSEDSGVTTETSITTDTEGGEGDEDSTGTQPGDNEDDGVLNPAALLDLAIEEGNYTLTLTIDEYYSTETCSYYEYILGTYDSDALINSLTYNGSYYDLIINYTEDALLIDYQLYGISLMKELYINCYAYNSTGTLVEALAEFDWDIYTSSWSYYDLYQYHWQYWFYSLFDAESYGLVDNNNFILSDSGVDTEGNAVELYTVGSSYTVIYLADILGAYDFIFGYPAEYLVDILWFGGVYTYPELNEFEFIAGLGVFNYASYYIDGYDDTSSDLVLVRENMDAYVSDIGTTTIDDELIESCMAQIS